MMVNVRKNASIILLQGNGGRAALCPPRIKCGTIPTTKPKPVNSMSQRLFLKDNELYYVIHKDLLDAEETLSQAKKENKPIELTLVPRKVEVIRAVFGIVLAGDPEHGYTLEHRISNVRTGDTLSGHLSLVDGIQQAVISAGEEFLANGQHKLSSNQTGGLFELLKEYKFTIADQKALLNLCFHGLAGEFYEMQLKQDGPLDEDAYLKFREDHGANKECISLTRFNIQSPAAIMRGLQITPTLTSSPSSEATSSTSEVATPASIPTDTAQNNNDPPGPTKLSN